MRFCDKLAKQRKLNNLSQELLADKLGVSRQSVSKWESGSTYPDMDKMIQMCKILNCTLEDLMDDGVISGDVKHEQKFNFNESLNEFLSFITKTVNMFSSMNFKEKCKCILEMFSVFLILLVICGIAFGIISMITDNLIHLLPYQISGILSNIFNTIYTLIAIVIGIICYIHIFKIRYLDYFITIEDESVSEKTIEEEVDKNQKEKRSFKEQSREKIIIRDPKHSSFSFISFLGKIILLFIKFFVIMMIIPIIMLFLLLCFFSIISLIHTGYGMIFLFIGLAGISVVSLLFVLLYFAYQFIFNRKINFKAMFIIIITSLVVLGCSSGIAFVIGLNYKYIDKFDMKLMNKKDTIISIDDNTHLTFANESNCEFIIDNTRTDALIEVYSADDFEFYLANNGNDKTGTIYYYIDNNEINYYNAYKLILKDLSKKRIRNYNYENTHKIKVYLNETDYQKIFSDR